MSEESNGGLRKIMTAQVQVPFTFSVIDAHDPSFRSSEQRAVTKSLNLGGLVFETGKMDVEGFHLSFADATHGRNSLEIILKMGKKSDIVEVLGQVEWYERRSGPEGFSFVVGVSFVDIQADALAMLRDFLQQFQKPAP
jgi:hypothetical protein